MTKDESLDDIIDRVAAEMTTVPADQGFSGRLAVRVDGRIRHARPAARWLVIAWPAVAVLLWAVFIRVPDERIDVRGRGEPLVQAPAPGQTSAPSITVVTPRGAVTAASPGGRRHHQPAARASVSASEAGAEVFSGPSLLSVAELAIDSVQLPAMADIVPLDVPALEIPAIALDEPTKEP